MKKRISLSHKLTNVPNSFFGKKKKILSNVPVFCIVNDHAAVCAVTQAVTQVLIYFFT